MTIFMIAAVALLVLGFFLNGGLNDLVFAYFTITPTDSYGDPSSYVGKKVLVEATFNGSTIQGSGTVVNDSEVWAEIDDSDTNPIGFLYFEEGRLVFETNDITSGQELTIKVSIAKEESEVAPDVIFCHITENDCDRSYAELRGYLESGISVLMVSDENTISPLTMALSSINTEYQYIDSSVPSLNRVHWGMISNGTITANVSKYQLVGITSD